MKIKIRLRPISAQKYLEINEKKYNNQILSNLNTLNNSFNIQKNCANNISNLISLNKLNYKHPLKHNFIKDEKKYYFDINNKIMHIAQIIEKKNFNNNIHTENNVNNNNHHNNHHNNHNNNHHNNHNNNHHKLKNFLPPINLKKIKLQSNDTFKITNSSMNLSVKSNNEKEYLINLIHDLNNDISYALKNNNTKKHKINKLKTIYKYINDTESHIKFHYFFPDFIEKNKNNIIDNPEYKFIKIKSKSFQICKMFTKILNIIIKYFYIVYNDDKLTNYKYIHQYFLKIKELYNSYKKELDDIIENYANITNNLIFDYNVYKHYINDLCEFTDLNINNEKEFKLDLENYDKRFEYLMK